MTDGMWGSDKINQQLGFHPATADTIPLYEANRAAAIAYACHLDSTCPAGPELTLALRAVEESLQRANQAVAINRTPLEQPDSRLLVQDLQHNRLTQQLTVMLRIPDGLPPEEMGRQVAHEVTTRLNRSATERSRR